MMKYLSVCVLLLAVGTAQAGLSFFDDWKNLNVGYNARGVGYNPVDNVVTVGESVAVPRTFAYNAETGVMYPPTPPAELPTTGLTFGSLGFFGGLTGSSNGKYYGMVSNVAAPTSPLKVWQNLTDPAPTEVTYNGGFSRNMFWIGDRLITTGSADAGPIQILDPDPITGAYNVTYSIGGGVDTPGGKGGATATQDCSLVWGIEGLYAAGTANNSIHQWHYDAVGNTYVFDGNIPVYDPYEAPPNPTKAGRGGIDVAVDKEEGLMFVYDWVHDSVSALQLNSDAVGDEVYVGSYPLGFNGDYYGGLEIDTVRNKLYWGVKVSAAADFCFGRLEYVPEPATLLLLGLGGLAVLRRR